MKNNHLQKDEIESYVLGALNDDEEECIIQHLGECEICLEKVEYFWNKREASGDFDQTRIKKQLFRRIYQTNVIGHFIRLSVKGFLYMITGLLYPLRQEKQVINLKENQKNE